MLPKDSDEAVAVAIQKWERTHRSTVVRRLLWEIFRLRAIALRADQYEEMTRSRNVGDPASVLISECLREDLDELPLIKEKRKRQDFLLYGHGEKQKRKGVNSFADEES